MMTQKTIEGRPLHYTDLDAAAPNHPVEVNHRGGHTSYVNSLALKQAGVTETTPDPPGGKFGRDNNGKLTGKILERASRAFSIPSGYTDQDYTDGVKLISQMLSKSGITSAHDAGGSTRDLKAYQEARTNGDLSVRIYCLMRSRNMERVNVAGMKTGFGDNMIRIGALKITCDGSISERTAALSQPYVGRPDDFGIIVTDYDELYKQAKVGYDAGWQIGIHANGDVGIDITLRVYERLMKENPKQDPRFRLEHCTVINDDLVRRIAAIGAIPNPFSTYVYFHGDKMHEYGAERLKNMFAVKSYLDAGVKVTQTSDYPPGPYEPMMAIQSSVTRTDMWGNEWGMNQKVTVEEAIKVGTLHGAYASFEENIKGSITEGKLADLVVLGKDITKIDPFTIVDTPIERTMCGGKWVYEG